MILPARLDRLVHTHMLYQDILEFSKFCPHISSPIIGESLPLYCTAFGPIMGSAWHISTCYYCWVTSPLLFVEAPCLLINFLFLVEHPIFGAPHPFGSFSRFTIATKWDIQYTAYFLNIHVAMWILSSMISQKIVMSPILSHDISRWIPI